MSGKLKTGPRTTTTQLEDMQYSKNDSWVADLGIAIGLLLVCVMVVVTVMKKKYRGN